MTVSTIVATLGAMALLTIPAAASPVAEEHSVPSCDLACVVDQAGVLTDEQEQELSARLREIGRRRGSRRGPSLEAIYAGLVVIKDGPDELDGYAQRALQRWGFGAKGVAIVIDPARGKVGLAAGESYRAALATQQAADARKTLASAQADAIKSGLEQLLEPVQTIARRDGESSSAVAFGLTIVFTLLFGIPMGIWRMKHRFGR